VHEANKEPISVHAKRESVCYFALSISQGALFGASSKETADFQPIAPAFCFLGLKIPLALSAASAKTQRMPLFLFEPDMRRFARAFLLFMLGCALWLAA